MNSRGKPAARREFACDCQSHIGTLDKACDEAVARSWTLVSMKVDRKTTFPPEEKQRRSSSLRYAGNV